MYICIFCSKSIYKSIFFYLIVGFCAPGRLAIGMIYINEFVPDSWQNIVSSLANGGNACVILL